MRFSRIVFWTLATGLFGAGALAGCSSSDSTPPPATKAKETCAPNAKCSAKLAGTKSDCLALTDNSAAAKAGLRISQLVITQPKALAQGAVASIVSNAVTLPLDDCHLTGSGTFSWLLELGGGKLKTGGAKPAADPTAGYCWVNEMVTGAAVAPIELAAPVGTDGTFGADVGSDVIVPIYLDAGAKDVVLLPLSAARIYEAKLSTDKNCIGSYNATGLSPDNLCLPEEGIPGYINAAKLDGYITLEKADTVLVKTLNETLCVLLAPSASQFSEGMDPKKCKRDANGKIVLTGDWCSTTNAAATADCADSFRLGADFAASAVKITGDCN